MHIIVPNTADVITWYAALKRWAQPDITRGNAERCTPAFAMQRRESLHHADANTEETNMHPLNHTFPIQVKESQSPKFRNRTDAKTKLIKCPQGWKSWKGLRRVFTQLPTTLFRVNMTGTANGMTQECVSAAQKRIFTAGPATARATQSLHAEVPRRVLTSAAGKSAVSSYARRK